MFSVGLKWAIKQFLLEPATLIQTSAIAFEIFGRARRACGALVCCQGYGNAITRGSCSGISAWLSSNLRWSKPCLLTWLENKITVIYPNRYPPALLMLQLAWQKEANQIVECHNLVQNSIVSQILEIKIRGVCSAGSVSFESRVAGNDKAINQSCLVFHLTRSLFAKTSPVHCYVHHHYCWAFRLQQNILFYDVCYTVGCPKKTKVRFLECHLPQWFS